MSFKNGKHFGGVHSDNAFPARANGREVNAGYKRFCEKRGIDPSYGKYTSRRKSFLKKENE